MRYQYTSSGYTNSLKDNWNSGVNVLLIVNILIFILLNWIVLNLNQSNYTVYKILFNNLSLIPQNILITPEVEKFQIWQCLTYLFLHGSFMHLFFNMLGLWFLGRDLENIWGKDKFLKYYFIVGIGSGLLTVLYNIQFVNSYDIRPVVGASGAIYGLLLAYGILFPNRILYIYGIFPVKVKNAVIFSGLISFFYSITLTQSGTSHITHLSGLVIGLLYLKYWSEQKKSNKVLKLNDDDIFTMRINQQKKVNNILDKISRVGYDGLSDEDKKFLKQQSKYYNDSANPN